jgi:hypothetical protein
VVGHGPAARPATTSAICAAVGAHLCQIFPKLGITTRAALRDALAALSPAPSGDDHSQP